MANYLVYSDYRDVLRDALDKRIAANPRYSMRAFARDLGVSPSKISEVLAAKHGLTRSDIKPLAKALKLGTHETQHFSDLVCLSLCRSHSEQKKINTRIAARRQTAAIKTTDLDRFAMVADWYHGAIFEYLNLKDRNHRPESIAKELGITKIEAEEALNRLERLGFVKKNGTRFEATEPHVFTESLEIPSLMIRRFHRQLVEKGKLSIDSRVNSSRDLFSILFAINEETLPILKDKLRKVQQELYELSTVSQKNADRLMCFSYQCFSIQEETSL